MAGSLLALLDDIVSVLDDLAAITKVATKKNRWRFRRRFSPQRQPTHRHGFRARISCHLGGREGFVVE